MAGKYDTVNNYFTTENFVNTCTLCDFKFKGQSKRRKYEHLLGVGTTVRSCKEKKQLLEDIVEELEDEYASILERGATFKKRKRTQVVVIADKLVTPKRKQKKLGFQPSRKDDIDMEYTRMVCMTSSKTTFMESMWTRTFFEKNWNYTPPSRSTVIRTLIPQLYDDTKRRCMNCVISVTLIVCAL